MYVYIYIYIYVYIYIYIYIYIYKYGFTDMPIYKYMTGIHHLGTITLGSIVVDYATVFSSATAFWFHALAGGALHARAERRCFDGCAPQTKMVAERRSFAD